MKLLHQAIVDREEQGESLSGLLPMGIAEKLRREGRDLGGTETRTVTVLMSDILDRLLPRSSGRVNAEALPSAQVKGRRAPVHAYRIAAHVTAPLRD